MAQRGMRCIVLFFAKRHGFHFLFAAFSLSPMIPLYPGGRAVCLCFCCDVERFMLGYRLCMFVYMCNGGEFEMNLRTTKSMRWGIGVMCVP
jgi:hypothetical protein